MIENLPITISSIFLATTIATLLLFYWVIKNSKEENIRNNSHKVVLILIGWLVLQATLSINNIYSQNPDAIPPKIFLFGVLPNIIIILGLFFTQKGRVFIDSLSLEKLMYINLVRIPVEIVLLWLYYSYLIPQVMTFEGWNFDILAGLTAPLIIYFGFRKNVIKKNFILAWHVIGLCLLIAIFILAILSAPSPIQKLAFDQPNIGLLLFPFSWLPTFIVPIVILGHFVSIRRIIKSNLI